jgi:WD40 repeat protein
LLVSGSANGFLEVWSLDRSVPLLEMRAHPFGLAEAVFVPNTNLVASASWDASVKLIEYPSGKIVSTFVGQVSACFCLAVSSDGSRLAAAGTDHTIRFWHIPSGQELGTIETPLRSSTRLAFLPGSDALLCANWEGVRIWSPPSLAEIDGVRLSR